MPTIDGRRLAHLKATQRDRDYSFIGELARRMKLRDQLLWSRSARDLIALGEQHPLEVESLSEQRPLLAFISEGRSVLERELDAERRNMREADELRMASFLGAARNWNQNWKLLSRHIEELSLLEAHKLLVQQAERLLPEAPNGRI